MSKVKAQEWIIRFDGTILNRMRIVDIEKIEDIKIQSEEKETKD